MRRDERAVTDIGEIFDMLSRCTTVSVGMNGGDFPYLVPMTFGCERNGEKITVYIHSAGAGKKWELLSRDPRVCVEGHLYYRVEPTENGGITAKFESVIGTGTAVRLTEQQDKVAAFRCMLAHYGNTGFPVTSCKGLSKAEVFRITLDEVTGKHNI